MWNKRRSGNKISLTSAVTNKIHFSGRCQESHLGKYLLPSFTKGPHFTDANMHKAAQD